MHTVVETRSFLAAADDAGLSEWERELIVAYIAENPRCGDEIPGTGGCRKVRFAGRQGGKRGGYRTITFYSGDEMPVFLITVFSKRERSDLTQAERNDLRQLSKTLSTAFKHQPLPPGRRS